ncbi:v-snare protein, Vti1 C-terminal half-like protein [Thalassiosira pseudonana CCMP1335]|uniref:V-snare protein, Vti1 C-terminal half-like protein n=1 Tax=Thalassiosira pseudonana TaxID=35128 RepID=B8C157_THAPS|nr:v-snare protein, Vti1 C-terminal half-like protein [Thalassiosira pseudonana CCMP1335]EED93182.1 v-snare protein, Vti1 C-terminal half-like protein [Thalassiosira pseudonana CCMP1335]
MRGLAEIEGDPFKAEEAKRKLEREIGPHLLRETQALCAESEQIGASTLEQMGRQREQLERTSGFIQQSLENTEQARQILKEMAYRALKNKIFLYCVIGVLVLANGGVLIHLWKRKT